MSDHEVRWTQDRYGIYGELICHADPRTGADCRLQCRYTSCEEVYCPPELDEHGWYHLYAFGAVELRHELRVAQCLIREWIDDMDGMALAYDGPPDSPVHDGPISLSWDADNWMWTYAEVEA